MKIGIVVYSQTGNTLSIAEKLKEKSDNNVIIEEIKATRDKTINLTNTPSIDKYDYIILASFVEAFHLNPVMIKYLKELKLENKKVSAFVTEAFSKPWLGGNKAIKQIEKILSEKNITLDKKGIINWNSKKREEQIKGLINDFSNI